MADQQILQGKKLDLAYWFVTNKLLLKSVLVAFLIIVVVVMVVYNLYVLIYEVGMHQQTYNLSLVDIRETNQDYEYLRLAEAPQPISVVSSRNFAKKNGVDYLFEVQNPNKDWWATFDYQLKTGTEIKAFRQMYILPTERKYILEANVTLGNSVQGLDFENIVWHREINYQQKKNDKYRFEVKNVNFTSDQKLGLGDEVPLSLLDFEITNMTNFNYYSINLIILLKSSGQVVAVTQVPSGKLLSQETKKIEKGFSQKLPRIDGFEIVPQVNFLSELEFFK